MKESLRPIELQNKNERDFLSSFVFWFITEVVLIAAAQIASSLLFGLHFGSGQVRLFPFRNYQFAFSLPVPVGIMFGLYSCIIVGCAWYVIKNWTMLGIGERCAWFLIGAGAFSNIFERLLYGYVRDYVYVLSGIFNIADGYILLGIVLLLLLSRRK